MNFLLQIFSLVIVCSPFLYSRPLKLESQIANKTLNYAPTSNKLDYGVLNYAPTWEDCGYGQWPRGRIDVNNDGRIDTCRTVGDANNPYIACDIGLADVYAYYSTRNLDLGYDNRPRGFVDANGDGYGDFCRCVGKPSKIFVSCMLGTATGFSADQYGFVPQVDSSEMCVPGFVF